MIITDVRVRKVAKEGKMKAVVSITIDDEFVVHDIKVIEGEKGLFIAMPSRKASDGEYKDIAHPINSATREKIQKIILEKYEAVAGHIAEIDELINQYAKGWKTTRMNKVDLAILRLAVYEMKWDEEVPVGVAINEAVELAKRFSGGDSPSFINGVLGKIARSADGDETK